jgi:photosystem II stability/assembly factor-like uncharacterized protein
MQSVDEPELSKRARRAVPLIAGALAVIVVAMLLYLRAGTPEPSPVIPPPAPQSLSGYLVAYDFVTPLVGWALVADSVESSSRPFWVFKTMDGAKDWQIQLTGFTPAWQMDIRFSDANHGVILFYASTVIAYRTSDAGVHWQQLALPGGAFDLTFAGSDSGWVLTRDQAGQSFHLLSTADGGTTWKQRVWPTGALPLRDARYGGLAFRSSGEGWVATGRQPPVLSRTADGGSTWDPLPITLPKSLDRVAFLTLLPQHGIIVLVGDSYASLVAFTSFDAGQTWRRIAGAPQPTRYVDFSFVDDTQWWAMRYGFLFKTSDAGQTWQNVRVMLLLEDWHYEPPHVIDSTHAWSQMISTGHSMVTALAMTSDGGVHWNPVNVPRPD